MQASKAERQWHLRNIVETTKGRHLIRKLYDDIRIGTADAKTSTAGRESSLNEMIDAVLDHEYSV
jgi:hypothetical protein